GDIAGLSVGILVFAFCAAAFSPKPYNVNEANDLAKYGSIATAEEICASIVRSSIRESIEGLLNKGPVVNDFKMPRGVRIDPVLTMTEDECIAFVDKNRPAPVLAPVPGS
ncbi:MAG TPA: hypothetical protein VIF12_00240, partial [Micavibrio sp.]